MLHSLIISPYYYKHSVRLEALPVLKIMLTSSRHQVSHTFVTSTQCNRILISRGVCRLRTTLLPYHCYHSTHHSPPTPVATTLPSTLLLCCRKLSITPATLTPYCSIHPPTLPSMNNSTTAIRTSTFRFTKLCRLLYMSTESLEAKLWTAWIPFP